MVLDLSVHLSSRVASGFSLDAHILQASARGVSFDAFHHVCGSIVSFLAVSVVFAASRSLSMCLMRHFIMFWYIVSRAHPPSWRQRRSSHSGFLGQFFADHDLRLGGDREALLEEAVRFRLPGFGCGDRRRWKTLDVLLRSGLVCELRRGASRRSPGIRHAQACVTSLK